MDIRLVEKFEVIEIGVGDMEPYFFEKLTLTTGNCNSGWEDLTEVQLTMQILRIFLDYDFLDKEFKKICLLKCGQIKELKTFRNSIRIIFYNDLTNKEFDEKFCE